MDTVLLRDRVVLSNLSSRTRNNKEQTKQVYLSDSFISGTGHKSPMVLLRNMPRSGCLKSHDLFVGHARSSNLLDDGNFSFSSKISGLRASDDDRVLGDSAGFLVVPVHRSRRNASISGHKGDSAA